MQWDYRVAWVETHKQDLQEVLRVVGKEGWELVTSHSYQQEQKTGYLLIFKRPIKARDA